MARLGRAQPFAPKIGRFQAASSPDVTIALTGVAATAAAGLLGVALSVGLTGTAGTGAVGTVTPVVGVTVALTGVAGTGGVGTLTPSLSVALAGVAGTGAVGTVTVGANVTVALTGVAGTGSVGTLGVLSWVTNFGDLTTLFVNYYENTLRDAHPTAVDTPTLIANDLSNVRAGASGEIDDANTMYAKKLS